MITVLPFGEPGRTGGAGGGATTGGFVPPLWGPWSVGGADTTGSSLWSWIERCLQDWGCIP